MLGVIHRSVIGLGPDHFRQYFRLATKSSNPNGRENKRRHSFQLETYRTGKYLKVLTHSVLGLIDIYNLLPVYVVEGQTVKSFQQRLQQLLKVVAMDGMLGWRHLYSPRNIIFDNALRDSFVCKEIQAQTPAVKRKCEDDVHQCMDAICLVNNDGLERFKIAS